MGAHPSKQDPSHSDQWLGIYYYQGVKQCMYFDSFVIDENVIMGQGYDFIRRFYFAGDLAYSKVDDISWIRMAKKYVVPKQQIFKYSNANSDKDLIIINTYFVGGQKIYYNGLISQKGTMIEGIWNMEGREDAVKPDQLSNPAQKNLFKIWKLTDSVVKQWNSNIEFKDESGLYSYQEVLFKSVIEKKGTYMVEPNEESLVQAFWLTTQPQEQQQIHFILNIRNQSDKTTKEASLACRKGKLISNITLEVEQALDQNGMPVIKCKGDTDKISASIKLFEVKQEEMQIPEELGEDQKGGAGEEDDQ